MSVESALQRVSTLQQALADPASLLSVARTGGTAAPAAPVQGAGEDDPAGTTSFAAQLQSASSGYASPGAESAVAGAGYALAPSSYVPSLSTGTLVGSQLGASATSPLGASAPVGTTSPPGALGTSPGSRIVAIAESQVGQAEQPPGSNEGPAIAEYRSATAGAAPGEPWCAYFASWAARQAGVPLGANGEGLGSVSQIWSWAQSSGRAIVNGPGVTPQPGDLIVFGSEHVGIVKGVLPNGQVQTIEGNYSNKVSENVRSPSEATGYVQLG
jgi:hypothetical protein